MQFWYFLFFVLFLLFINSFFTQEIKMNKESDIKHEIKMMIFRKLDAMGYKRTKNNYKDYESAKKYFEPELHHYVAEYLGV
jgi:hypothetical protein